MGASVETGRRTSDFTRGMPDAAPKAKEPSPQFDIQWMNRFIDAFEKKSAIAVDHLNAMVTQRARDKLLAIGMDDGDAFLEDLRAKVSEYYDRELDQFRLSPNSSEMRQSVPKKEAAFRDVCETALKINVARYGKEGALVVERIGCIAAIRRTAAEEMRETLRSVEKTMPSEPEAAGGFYWLDQITEPAAIGAPGDPDEGETESAASILRRRRQQKRRQEMEEEERKEAQRKTSQPPQTMEDVSSLVAASEATVQKYERARRDAAPKYWSVLDFMITNPCLRRALKISEVLDNFSKAFGSKEARMTEQGFVPAGFLNRASQYARGAVQEAEARGAYRVTSVATGRGAVIVGRILSGLTTWMNMNTYRALEYESGLQSRLAQELLKKINEQSTEALKEVGDLSSAWNALTTVASPTSYGGRTPIANPSESLVRAIYATCGPKEGLGRIFQIAMSSNSATPLISGDPTIDTYFNAMSGNGPQLLSGEVLGADAPISQMVLTEEQSAKALEYLVAAVNNLPASSAPASLMDRVLWLKTERMIKRTQADIKPLQDELDQINIRIAEIESDSLVSFMKLAQGYGLQYLSVVFPDFMNFYLAGGFIRMLVRFVDSYTGGYIGHGTDYLNKAVCGGSLEMFEKILGLFGVGVEGVSLTSIGLTILSGGGVFASAYQAWQSFVTSGGNVQRTMQYVGNIFHRILKTVTDRISQVWKALTLDNLVASMESTGLVRPAAYLIWWILEDVAKIIETMTGIENLRIGQALSGLFRGLAFRAKVEAFISILPQAASVLFQAARIYYGAASVLNVLVQVTSFLLSGMVALPLSVPLMPAVLGGLVVALGISPWLLPYELLQGTSLEFAGDAFLSLRRALGYYVVDPMHDAAVFFVPVQFRKMLQSTGGFFGNIGNFVCMRPEYGTVVLTFLSILFKHNLGFAINKALLGDYKAGLESTERRTKEVRSQTNASYTLQNIVSTSPEMSEKMRNDVYQLLSRYASTVCSLGEGRVTGEAAYNALAETFFEI